MKISYCLSGVALVINAYMILTIKGYESGILMSIVAVGFIAQFLYDLIKS